MELNSSSDAYRNANALHFSDEELILVAAWRHEVFHIALTTAFATLSLNSMVDNSSPECAVLTEIMAPNEAAINRAITQGLLDMPLMLSDVFQSVGMAYEKLNLAIDLFSTFTCGRQDLFLTLGDVKNSWQSACQQFQVTIGRFEKRGLVEVPLQHTSEYSTPQIWILSKLLQAGMAGETIDSANIDLKQSLDVPTANNKRRRWDRRNIELGCLVSAVGHSQRAYMRNVSVGGALLDGIDCFARGVKILISTDGDRNFEASVVWATDGRTGVKFHIPLSISDPLLSNKTGYS